MADRRDEIWEARAQRAYSQVTYHPWRTLLKGVGIVVLLALVISLIGIPAGWYSGTRNLTTFNHSKEQTTAVLTDWTTLQASACNAKDATDSKSADGPTLIEDPALAYKATYRNTKADYDRRMNNFFEAYVTRHIPIPAGITNLPRIAPPLAEAERMWC